MDIKRSLGIGVRYDDPLQRERILRYINLKLASMGLPFSDVTDANDIELAHDLIENYKEKNRLLSTYLCPVDRRIQDFLDSYLEDVPLVENIGLPTDTLILDRYGLARELSLSPNKDEFITDIVHSYRVKQGVLHNPKHDRRTTKGSFHIAEGGLPIPFDKKAVPKQTFAYLLEAALAPPDDLKLLPYTSEQKDKARTFVSLLLRPAVVPEVEGFIDRKKLEVRLFVPGNLVSNLDFAESIFGNAGDPYLPENDAALDPEGWTGHTGCIILAPHLIRITKKEAGLPSVEFATDRQKKDGMCWENENELYNDGTPFKLTCRDERGVMVTLIADNYFGYTKKEVKTQIGYSANLMGLAEEEHAGGALAFPSYNLGVHFVPDSNLHASADHTFGNVIHVLGNEVAIHEDGYGVDKNFDNIFYIPENAEIDLEKQAVIWKKKGKERRLKILPDRYYIHPTGYKVNMEKDPASPAWRLVGTTAEGTFCHKPCTVSGGGKSEISKSIWDSLKFGSVYVGDFKEDMDMVEELINKSYSTRFKPEYRATLKKGHTSRPILSSERSLGSVIKLLSPSSHCTDEYNEWVNAIPTRIKALVFLVKRFYTPNWGDDWRSRFSVNIVNNEPGHEFCYKNRKIMGAYLRVGTMKDGSWVTNKLRQDFIPAIKVQMEDDISCSVVVPASELMGLAEGTIGDSVKIVENCEYRFFQRPDDAVIRGYDKQAETDLSSPGNFISNFEPLKKEDAIELIESTISFCDYSEPVKKMIQDFAESSGDGEYFIASSHPRLVDGKPTKNPRYLQTRPDLVDPTFKYMSEVGTRLFRKIPSGEPLYMPVNAILGGRRNNPADYANGIRPLAVYGPIHYQELPELFMDFICSLTGKSPSTTGAGSEGALTKAPFNALSATTDLNNALLSFILTGYSGYTSAAGYIGSKYRVDHDISLLIPELWCRLSEEERNPKNLIEEGYLEKVEDFAYKGETILASRLGYRINRDFLNAYLGRMFDNPEVVFDEDMLRPELQSIDEFADGVKNIVEAQLKVAKNYILDGSVEGAIPPLKALLYIMAEGSYEGKTAADPEIRQLFDKDLVLKSDWYQDRLKRFQESQISLSKKNIAYLEEFLREEKNRDEAGRLGIPSRLSRAKKRLAMVSAPEYLDCLVGTLGLDNIYKG